MFQVQNKLCTSCIYRKDCPLNLTELEAQVSDPHGGFKGHRECHHAKRGSNVCCRGFWNAHKDSFPVGQVAQRLNLVEFVNIDVLINK